MTDQTKVTAGNALLITLLIVALVGVAVGGWIYTNKKNMDALPDPVGTQETLAPPATAPDVATDEQGNAVPMTTDETVPTPVVSNVKIDVAKAMSTRAIGDPNAPIKIIEYASLTCSHCAHFHNDVLPELKTKYIDTGKVYLEFHEFPLNDPALKAALTARCLPENRYESFTALLFKTQDHWAGNLNYMAALKQNAKLAGMSDATFDACQAEPQLKLKIAENMQQGKDKWKISATPTFVINNGAETISGAMPLSEFERVFRKVSHDTIGTVPEVK